MQQKSQNKEQGDRTRAGSINNKQVVRTESAGKPTSREIGRKKYNQRKYIIFSLIARANHPIRAIDLVFAQSISRANADNRLSKMRRQGYLLLAGRGRYRLSAKGKRVRERLMNRREIEKTVGEEVTLNLNKPVPSALLQKYHEVTGRPAPFNI